MQTNNTLPPTYSRNVIHGNNMNKKGCVFAYQRSIRPSKVSFKKSKVSKLLSPANEQLLRDFGDFVVRAGPPKKVEDSISYPVKFTIPNCPNNINLIEQVYIISLIIIFAFF